MNNQKSNFKFLEHTADIKFQAFGKSLEEVFENSALAMFNSMFDGKVKKTQKFKVKAEGKDNENLLYNFLEELIVLFDGKQFFLSGVEKIKIKDGKLQAEVVGDKAENYEINIDVKAITYSEMFVKKKGSEWIAQVVLDV
ncbi:archease [Candidatus Pacearchaeota archaeon]|nr:archease [Candidatus Pacearchaeota archaeon]